MSFYWFNRQELLQKAKDRYHNCGGKAKAAKYYLENKEVLKEKTRNNYRNFLEEEKQAKRQYRRNRYRNMKETKLLLRRCKNKTLIFCIV